MKIKAITFNIRCCDDKDGHAIFERAPRLAEATLPYDADIIGFQEYRPKWEEHVEKYYGEKYEIFNKYRDDNRPESAPILWKKDRFDLIDKGYFWLSDTPEIPSDGWDTLGHKRIAEYVVLSCKESGRKFAYINTHYGFGDECHIKSSKLIYEYSKKISDLPTFITGDFNMPPKARDMLKLQSILSMQISLPIRTRKPPITGTTPRSTQMPT